MNINLDGSINYSFILKGILTFYGISVINEHTFMLPLVINSQDFNYHYGGFLSFGLTKIDINDNKYQCISFQSFNATELGLIQLNNSFSNQPN